MTGGVSMIRDVGFGSSLSRADSRGSFRELWRASWVSGFAPELAGRANAQFVQANFSRSTPGVLRGLHLHLRQLDFWAVASGRAFAALVDVRPLLAGAAAAPTVETRELSEGDWVVIPTGVAHGFLALEHLDLVYLVTNEFDGSDELGFAWNDPLAAVPWPSVANTLDGQPILSDRDRSNPSLSDFVAGLRR